MKIRFEAGLAAAALGLAALLTLPSVAQATETQFKLVLSGKQETPPNTTKGKGRGTASYDDQTHTLSYNITYSGLTGDATAAHFHGPAKPGQSAPPTVPIDKTGLASPITGTATLTDDQATQLLAGQWYFNVHTASNPNGEIRGQVRKAPGKPVPTAAPAPAGQ